MTAGPICGRRAPGTLPVPGQRACQSRKIRLALPLQTLTRTVSPIGAEPMNLLLEIGNLPHPLETRLNRAVEQIDSCLKSPQRSIYRNRHLASQTPMTPRCP